MARGVKTFIRARRLVGVPLLVAMVLSATGCGTPSEGPDTSGASHPTSSPAPTPAQAAAVPRPRLVRRLTIDLFERLPTSQELASVTSEEQSLSAFVDAALANPESAKGLANLHRWIWNLDARHLDLDAIDTMQALTPALRDDIAAEPLLLLRRVFTDGEPFSAVFSAPYTVLSSNAASLWGLNAGSNAFPGDASELTAYQDGRPAAGILATNGFLAAFANEARSDLTARTARILTQLTCQNLDNPAAHLFKELSADVFSPTLSAYASQNAPCSSCHRLYDSAASAYSGLGYGTTLASYGHYQPPTNASQSGFYAGIPFQGLDGLGALLGRDPRVSRCEFLGLNSALLQRPPTLGDATNLLPSLMQAYAAADHTLITAIKRLLLSSAYASDISAAPSQAPATPSPLPLPLPQPAPAPIPLPTPEATDSPPTPATPPSGARFLNRDAWTGILAHLSPATSTIAIPPDLDPGAMEDIGRSYRMPLDPYWHDANEVARFAAAAIIGAELGGTTAASSRTLLTLLPSGSGKGAGLDAARAQIKSLWTTLTALTLQDTDDQFVQLFNLWQSIIGDGTSDAQSRTAWQAVLVAMFLSPEFVTY